MNKPTVTKEEMNTGIEKLQERLLDNAYNGEDKEKDRLCAVLLEEKRKVKSFELFKDNKIELDNFMREFNIIDIFKFNINRYVVQYPFADYHIIGKSANENQQDILDKYKKFMDMAHLTKLNLNKFETFDYLPHPRIISKARRLRDNYLSADVDTRCFIPEFIFGIPIHLIDEYFLIYLVINNLCDGLLADNLVPEDIRYRIKLKAYPVIYLNRKHGEDVNNKIKSSSEFIMKNNQYFIY